MRSKIYEVIIGILIPEVKDASGTVTTGSQYNPDLKHVMVVAKDVTEAISKVKLEKDQHIESVARHNFIDVV